MCQISKQREHLAAILFGDNTDIVHIDPREKQIVHEAHDTL